MPTASGLDNILCVAITVEVDALAATILGIAPRFEPGLTIDIAIVLQEIRPASLKRSTASAPDDQHEGDNPVEDETTPSAPTLVAVSETQPHRETVSPTPDES